jgi:hypothetical protein
MLFSDQSVDYGGSGHVSTNGEADSVASKRLTSLFSQRLHSGSKDGLYVHCDLPSSLYLFQMQHHAMKVGSKELVWL